MLTEVFNTVFFLSTDSVDLNLNVPTYSSLSMKNNKSVLKCNNYGGYGDYLQVLCKEKLSELFWSSVGRIRLLYCILTWWQCYSFVFGSNKTSWKCDFPKSNIQVEHNWLLTDISLVSKIGVFLDQEAGTVSFYNVSDKMTLLHRIQTTFTAPLYPGFSFKNLENKSSVTICDLPS